MDIIIITNVSTADLPDVKRILGDAGVGGSVVESAPQPQPQVSAPSAPSVSSDPASAARAARTFYSQVAQAIGQSKLTSDQQAVAKQYRKQGHDVASVASMLSPAAPPAPVDPQAARMAQLEAELAAMRGTPATPPAPVVAQRENLLARTTMPDLGSDLAPSERQALLTWADVTLAHPARKAAVQQYCGGQVTWAQVTDLGVKAKSALRVLANHS